MLYLNIEIHFRLHINSLFVTKEVKNNSLCALYGIRKKLHNSKESN